MAILTRNNNTENYTIHNAGMVIQEIWKNERVMSDVWAMFQYAVVYDIIQDQVREICVHCDFDDAKDVRVIPDASPALVEQYKKHLDNERRHQEALRLANEHRTRWEQAHHMNVSLSEYKKLVRLGKARYDILYTLLGTKKFRNQFRAGLAQQVRDWLKEENPKYASPLSPRQFECADNRPRWTRRYY